MFCANETFLVNGTDPDIQDLDSANASTASVSKLVNYYITDIAMPATCALGILGNLLSLMVLTTEKLHRTLSKMEISAHIGLTALAVSDFLFCLLVLIVTQLRRNIVVKQKETKLTVFEISTPGIARRLTGTLSINERISASFCYDPRNKRSRAALQLGGRRTAGHPSDRSMDEWTDGSKRPTDQQIEEGRGKYT
ncbi:hypothetical protein Btru_077819 [Bulinus truncatus]|nr:hypothetical protein Btru_077819 [Bulinus truncatus]